MSDRKHKHSSKYDTEKIPITRTEKEVTDHNNQTYNHRNVIKPQVQNSTPICGPKPNKSPKHNKLTKFILSVILVFSIICGSLLGHVYSLCSKTDYIPSDNGIIINTTNIENNVYNVLLIGTDKEEDGASRSDSMILLTINNNQKVIKLTSFLRDLWIKIPRHDYARLNAAYSLGGPQLVMETISYNFDIKIDNYILVDFDMFKELIDSIGGVIVNITQAEAEFINRTTHAKVNSGMNTLNGDYALIYCRIRKLDSDFMRTQRQRKVITAIVNKVRNQNILDTISVASGVLPFISTDISPLKMTAKILGASRYLTYTTEQTRIPSDGTYENQTINSQAVLVPDLEKNINSIHEFIY